jgi:hypothetical protein
MSKKKPSPSTLPNLFEWTPPPIVKRFDDARVRTVEIGTQLSRGVAETLRGLDRKEVAADMSSWLGEPVSDKMLDKYASQADGAHMISLPRAVALIHATGDVRLLQMIAETIGYVVIEETWLFAVKEAQLSEKMERLAREKKACRKGWKGGAA